MLAVSTFSAKAEISVSRTFQTQPLNQAVNVQAGGYRILPLPGETAGDAYLVRVDSENKVWRDISAFIVDDLNLQLFKAGARFHAAGRTKGLTPFEIRALRSSTKQLYLVIDNRYSLLTTKLARVSVTLTTKLNEEQAEKLETVLGGLYSLAHTTFKLPEFDVRVKPCNSVNASSERDTGHITICSEFVSMYANKPEIFGWVFLHELGHTALGLWGIPGNDNEDMADEFATALLLHSKDGSRIVMQAMEFFRDSNPSAEAQHTIRNGDRHSLSIQRVRNVQGWLLEPVRVTTKWNNLLYRQMTEGKLQEIIDKPSAYDNQKLAREQLSSRSFATKVTDAAEQATSPFLGCSKDTDCKGERICERGACVNP
ncbi:MAG: DUF4344 domain-containing metallopeptidase [Thiobacillus sp.]|nr:DUF4344 domain-containing metallopeptidase [Thiobacillus sp.]